MAEIVFGLPSYSPIRRGQVPRESKIEYWPLEPVKGAAGTERTKHCARCVHDCAYTCMSDTEAQKVSVSGELLLGSAVPMDVSARL